MKNVWCLDAGRKQYEGELITVETKEFFRPDGNNDDGRCSIPDDDEDEKDERASITQLSI